MTEGNPVHNQAGHVDELCEGLPTPDDSPLVAVAANLVRDRIPVRVCLSPSPFRKNGEGWGGVDTRVIIEHIYYLWVRLFVSNIFYETNTNRQTPSSTGS